MTHDEPTVHGDADGVGAAPDIRGAPEKAIGWKYQHLIAGIAALVVAISPLIGTWLVGSDQPDPTEPAVFIDYPPPQEQVLRPMFMEGRASGVPGDHTLWIVIDAYDGFYPQPEAVGRLHLDPDGRWCSGALYLGSGELSEQGEPVVLHVVLADSFATDELRDHPNIAITNLPPGSRTLERVTVEIGSTVDPADARAC